MYNLEEHVGAVVGVLMVVGAIVGFTIKWIFFRMQADITYIKDKIDLIFCEQSKCQRELPEKYVLKVDYRSDMDDVWSAINNHTHDKDSGRALR